jgi:predicted ATP-binding protein involved in virulence
MKIERIKLGNFKTFDDCEFSFSERLNVVVGDNASGKTTLLDAISVGLGSLFLGFPLPAIPRNIRRDEATLRRNRDGGSLVVEPQFPVTVTCTGKVDGRVGEWRRELSSEDGRTSRQDTFWIRDVGRRSAARIRQGKPAILPIISYYGTPRLWVQIRQRAIRALNSDTRFIGYLDCLNPASDFRRLFEWFKAQHRSVLDRKAPSAALEVVRKAIRSCIPSLEHIEFNVERDEPLVRIERESLPFSYLSDGQRNMIAMVGDLAVRCAILNPQLTEAATELTPGVVLIDELDLHLDPSWQRRVIKDFLRTFPRVQFFATTHSPFVIESLPTSEGVGILDLGAATVGNGVKASSKDPQRGPPGSGFLAKGAIG